METGQRVVHRNPIFSRLIWILAAIAVLLLGQCLVRQNVTGDMARSWPWRLQLLDVQSAVTAVLGTVGAGLARAQYALAVRPALGGVGSVTADVAPNGQPAWLFGIVNGSQDVAVVDRMEFWIEFTATAVAAGASNPGEWIGQPEAVGRVEAVGQVSNKDFRLKLITTGFPLVGGVSIPFAWFTEKSMREIGEMYARIRVVDRLGDTHERVLSLLKGADRRVQYIDRVPLL